MAEGYLDNGLTTEELVALPPYNEVAGMTFIEIEAIYGAEIAINVGIATDPDTWVPTDEEFARARPAIEVDPDLVNAYLAGKLNGPAKVNVEVTLDSDILYHFKNGDPDWQARLNDALRQAIADQLGRPAESTPLSHTPAAD